MAVVRVKVGERSLEKSAAMRSVQIGDKLPHLVKSEVLIIH